MAVRALLVGIDAYSAVQPLNGCVNDMRRLAELLRTHVLDTPLELELLLDEQATYDGIVATFRRHLGAAAAGDLALFAFAGHGSQEPAPPELHVIEPDRRNETLVCVDSRTNGVHDLADKELSVLIGEVAARGARVLCLFDCCHSGTASRGDEEDREEPGVRHARGAGERPFSSYLPALQDRAGGAAEWVEPPHVALSACQSSELAKEVLVGGHTRGAFSAAFEHALAIDGPSASVRTLARTARSQVLVTAQAQTPVAYATDDADLDRPVFGEGAVVRDRTHRLYPREGGWEVDGGALHGLVPGARLAVRRPGADTVLGEVEVADTGPANARVRVVGDVALDPAEAHRAVLVRRPAPALTVAVDAPELAELVASSPLLGLAADAADAVVAGRLEGAELVLVDANGARLPLDPLPADDAGRLIAVLEHLARWEALRTLETPDSPLARQVGIEWVPVQPGETSLPADRGAEDPPRHDGAVRIDYVRDGASWRPAEWFLRITNTSERALHAVVLDLTDRYRVHDLLFRAASEPVGSGRSAPLYGGRPVPFTISGAGPLLPGARGRDWLKLVVSEHPIDGSAVVLPELAETAQRAARPAAAPSDDRGIGEPVTAGAAWAVVTVPVEVCVPEG